MYALSICHCHPLTNDLCPSIKGFKGYLYGVILTCTVATLHKYLLVFLNQYPYWQLIKFWVCSKMLTSHSQYQPKPIMSSSMATVPVLFQVNPLGH